MLDCDCAGAVAFREAEEKRKGYEEDRERKWQAERDAKCPTCGGDGYRRVLSGEDPSKIACSCEYGITWNIAQADAADLLPPRFRAARLADFGETTVKAVGTIQPEKGVGLLIHGTVGTGKTHLVAAFIYSLLERVSYSDVLFVTMPDLLDRIRTSYNAPIRDDVLERALSVPVLVLDDLGKEKITDWVLEKVYQIVNRRYNYQLTTICTTNKAPSQLARHLNDAIASRLMEMCRVVKLSGEDRRTR
ncbi:MAG: AFG1/ZapE family ATPase [Pseudomonadota bacterium]